MISMNIVWMAFCALLVLALVRRHGWEYVPPVVAIALGRWYVSGRAIDQYADLLMLVAVGAVWMISKRTRGEAPPARVMR